MNDGFKWASFKSSFAELLLLFWRWVQNFGVRSTMCSDELLGRDTIQGCVSITLARIHVRTKPHFKMQMCQIGTFGRSDCTDLVTTLHILSCLDSD